MHRKRAIRASCPYYKEGKICTNTEKIAYNKTERCMKDTGSCSAWFKLAVEAMKEKNLFRC